MSSEKQVPFVTWLESVRDSNDQAYSRSTLAILRRGSASAPGEDANVLRYVVPWLPTDAAPWVERPYFTIAPLFALHPLPGGMGDMGSHFRRIQQGKQGEDAIERRFTALLNTHEDELAWHLRQAVSLCKVNVVPVNWHALFDAIRGWSRPNRWVQRNWAQSFWSRTVETHKAAETDVETQAQP
jgi:CRISPR system Cascade subunit CasB